ncbi:MAG: endopeptidase La, partial [Oligoflexales bacterium]|nr:endopeptidase La [Oligoflexales bacterium]
RDIHIHVPAGAIHKDGPSAGLPILVTLASLFTGRQVNPLIAMTGEITLRGIIMPVGGIREKVISAHRAGIKKVILPGRNQKDLQDIPDEIREQLDFEFVEYAHEALKLALDIDISQRPGWPGNSSINLVSA